MSDTESLLIYAARQLKEQLAKRHSISPQPTQIVRWAKASAKSQPAINDDPAWWIQSACVDIECLDACADMLRGA